jgi:hypothetical protein
VAKVDAYAVNRTPAEQLEMLKDIANSWNEVGGRLAYNLNSVAIVRDNPINGVGLGNFFGIWPAYHDAFVPTPDNSYNVMARPQRTHTDLMQAFTEMGIPGGILYAMLFVLGMVAAFRLAGARAGALSGKVLGAGLGLTLLVVMLFLHVRNFVPLGGVWLVVLPGALGSLTVGLSAWALRDAWQLHCANRKSPTPAATDEQLMGLAAGLGVVTICINALMDFPMQLPTAPAATMMLLGLVTALAVRQGAMRYAPWGGASVWPRSAAVVGLGLVETKAVAPHAWRITRLCGQFAALHPIRAGPQVDARLMGEIEYQLFVSVMRAEVVRPNKMARKHRRALHRPCLDHQSAAHLDLGVDDHPQLVIAVDGCVVAVFGDDLVLGHIHPGAIGLQRVGLQNLQGFELAVEGQLLLALLPDALLGVDAQIALQQVGELAVLQHMKAVHGTHHRECGHILRRRRAEPAQP